MNKIDRDKFFFLYSNQYKLTDEKRSSIEQILSFLEADERVTDFRHAAYMLATVKRECGDEWKPIREYSRGKGLKYGKPDPVTGKVYYGRGYVQLTWKDNYKTMGDVLKVDLVNNPDLALDAKIAYRIMSYGMRNGSFTGVGLKRYIHDDVCDFKNARRIINGTDVADLIAGFATNILACLEGAKEEAHETVSA